MNGQKTKETTRPVRISEGIYARLRYHIGLNGGTMTDFMSDALDKILPELPKSKKQKRQ